MNSSMVLITALLFISSLHAAPAQIEIRQQASFSAKEILSLPPENRRAVANSRGGMIPELEKLAKDKNQDFRDRWSAFVLAAQLKGPRAEAYLREGLKSKEWFIRNAALLAFDEMYPQKAKNIATAMLNDKALVIRSAAVMVLAKRMDDLSRETLWSELEHRRNFRKGQSLFVRSQLVAALAQDPLPREKILFIQALSDRDTRLHGPAMVGLEKITSRRLGSVSDSISDRREKWLAWAQKNPDSL